MKVLQRFALWCWIASLLLGQAWPLLLGCVLWWWMR
jgi:hypothetical protein